MSNMATSRSREPNTSMTEDTGGQLLTSKPAGWWGALRHYLHEVSLEMKKVSWPTRPEVINTTLVVILAVFFFGAFLFLSDVVLSYVVKWLEAGARMLFT